MTTYAQIIDETAMDVIVVLEGFTISDMVHADILGLFVEVPDGTVNGSKEVNGVWVAPEPEVLAAPPYTTLTPMQFYLAFTPAERIAIKSNTDPHVQEFLATLNLSIQLKENVDPNLVSVQEALQFLATSTTAEPAGPGILAESRITEILQGIPQ